MIFSENKCALSCPSTLKGISGFCVKKELILEETQNLTTFIIQKIDDLTYSFTSSRPILSLISLVDKIHLSIEGLEQGTDYKYIITQVKDSNEYKIKFRFFKSFQNKKIQINLKQPQNLTKLQQNNSSTETFDLIDENFSIISDLSSELLIGRLDIDNLTLTDQDSSLSSPKHFFISWISNVMLFFSIAYLCLILLSLITFLLANHISYINVRIRQLKFWVFILLYQIFWVYCLGLINRPLPDNFHTFLSSIYLYTIGLDDLPPSYANFSINEPQFYRYFKSNSFIQNSIFILCIYGSVLMISVLYSNSANKKQTIVRRLMSLLIGNPMFVLLFPISLYPFVNSVICIRSFNSTNPFNFFDLTSSLIYIGFIISCKLY
jgi:hypothetical protein